MHRFIVVTPAAPGSKGDEGMLRGMLKSLGGRTIFVLNPEQSPLWSSIICKNSNADSAFTEVAGPFRTFHEQLRPTDTLLVLGADVIDGTCGLEPSISRLDLIKAALEVGAKVFVFCSFRSDVNPEITARIRQAGDAMYFMRDPLSVENFRRQTDLVARAFSDFYIFCDAVLTERASSNKYLLSCLSTLGKAVVGINFCEHAFRSFYDIHTNDNRLEYVANALSVTTRVIQNPYFVLISNDSRRWPGHKSDSDYQEIAMQWLDDNGYADDVDLLEPDIGYPEILAVVSSLDLVITGRMHLALATFRAGVVPVVLMGYGRGYTSVDKMRGAFTQYLGRTDLVATDPEELRAALETTQREYSLLCGILKGSYSAIVQEAHANLEALRENLDGLSNREDAPAESGNPMETGREVPSCFSRLEVENNGMQELPSAISEETSRQTTRGICRHNGDTKERRESTIPDLGADKRISDAFDDTERLAPMRSSQVAWLNRVVVERAEVIEKHSERITDLHRLVVQQASVMASLNKAGAQQVAEITVLKRSMTNQARDNAGLKRLLASRDSEIASLKELLAATQSSLTEVVNSRSWRITRPYRGIGDMVTCAIGTVTRAARAIWSLK